MKPTRSRLKRRRRSKRTLKRNGGRYNWERVAETIIGKPVTRAAIQTFTSKSSSRITFDEDYFNKYKDVHFVQVCDSIFGNFEYNKHYVAVKKSDQTYIDLGHLQPTVCKSTDGVEHYNPTRCKLYCTFLNFDKFSFCEPIEKCPNSKLRKCNKSEYVESKVPLVKDYTFYCYEPLESGFVDFDIENDVKMEKAELRNGMTSRPCQ